MKSTTKSMKRIFLLLLVGITFFALPQIDGWACDTPVYRYAMYRWQPTPHEVYFFYEGEIDSENAKIGQAIRQANEKKDFPANVVFLPVDVAQDKELATVPPDVKAAFQDRKEPTLPTYMTFTPQGVHTRTGQLQEDDLAAMLQSPARKKMAQLLKEGCICVFVLLTNDDEASNQKSEEVLTLLAKDIGSGKVKLYSGPEDQFPEVEKKKEAPEKKETADEAKKDEPKHKIGFVKVSRDDKAEQWFVRTLLAVRDRNEFEDDLHTYNEPMAFPVYGRARALPPYIGKGITRDNMIGVVEFVSGACSCTVKEQNPGVDLLVSYDWEAAAAALAEIYGTEEGNEKQVGAEDLFPDLIIPPAAEINPPVAKGSDDTTATTTGSGEPSSTDDPDSTTVAVTNDAPPNPNEIDTADPAVVPEKIEKDADSGREIAANTPLNDKESAEKKTTNLSIWTVGGGILIGLVALFIATFAIIRPR